LKNSENLIVYLEVKVSFLYTQQFILRMDAVFLGMAYPSYKRKSFLSTFDRSPDNYHPGKYHPDTRHLGH